MKIPARSNHTGESLLTDAGLDPDKYQLTNAWVKNPDVSVHIRPLATAVEPFTVAELEDILRGYEPPASGQAAFDDKKVLLVCIADQQVGKPDKGGTNSLIKQWINAVVKVQDRIRNETKTGRVSKIVLAHLGDACEGAISQGGRLRHDVGITEEFRVARRMLLDTIVRLAPLTDQLYVGAVPSNHGEARRDRATEPNDNWCIEVVRAVEDAFDMTSDYDHVYFRYPEDDEISLAIDVGSHKKPILVGMAHGHIGTRNPNSVAKWIEGQVAGNQVLAPCQVICTGHFHHARIEDIGIGRVWIQAPALESGSDWFRHRTGKDSAKGILSAWLSPEGVSGISW